MTINKILNNFLYMWNFHNKQLPHKLEAESTFSSSSVSITQKCDLRHVNQSNPYETLLNIDTMSMSVLQRTSVPLLYWYQNAQSS